MEIVFFITIVVLGINRLYINKKEKQLMDKFNVQKRYKFIGGGVGRQPKRYDEYYVKDGHRIYFSKSDNGEDVVKLCVNNEILNDSKYTGSKRSMIYHDSNCKWAKKVSSISIVRFNTVLEAENNGFRPCKECLSNNRKNDQTTHYAIQKKLIR